MDVLRKHTTGNLKDKVDVLRTVIQEPMECGEEGSDDENLFGWCHTQTSSALFAIKRIKTISTQAASKTAYCVLFESHVWYGIVVWGSSTARNMQHVLINKRKLNEIGIGTRDSCSQDLKELRILTPPSL
ncbi:hypothetical protein J6590_034484 [Homalodisca vitripennis]|nr:hypothetical protein J6590_034484 [Homalodisca vitripennis]